MTKTTPSDFRPQTSDFILVKDYISWEFHFLRQQHLNKDFLQDFLRSNFQNNSVDKKSVSSVCSVDKYPMIR